MRKPEPVRRSSSAGEQILPRMRVKVKSDLAVGGSCQVVRVKKKPNEEGWDEVGEQFEAFAGVIRFSAEYIPPEVEGEEEQEPLYGLIERWPDTNRWEFYQLDCREE